MLIDSIKEACDTLEKVVDDYVNDSWNKNQAIDALVYLRENAIEVYDIDTELEDIEKSVEEIRKELRTAI